VPARGRVTRRLAPPDLLDHHRVDPSLKPVSHLPVGRVEPAAVAYVELADRVAGVGSLVGMSATNGANAELSDRRRKRKVEREQAVRIAAGLRAEGRGGSSSPASGSAMSSSFTPHLLPHGFSPSNGIREVHLRRLDPLHWAGDLVPRRWDGGKRCGVKDGKSMTRRSKVTAERRAHRRGGAAFGGAPCSPLTLVTTRAS
jgi:hypothetical protein